jgi:hypothetical protein
MEPLELDECQDTMEQLAQLEKRIEELEQQRYELRKQFKGSPLAKRWFDTYGYYLC